MGRKKDQAVAIRTSVCFQPALSRQAGGAAFKLGDERTPIENRVKETGDAMIGAKLEVTKRVGQEVKSAEARCPNRPAASYFGHRLSRLRQKTPTARKPRGEPLTAPAECRPPVTHSKSSDE